jgi:CheY-like chemotaxis protein
MGGPLP